MHRITIPTCRAHAASPFAFNWERMLVKNDLPFRAGSATLPWRDDDANIMIFSSGLGDGSYALVGGLDVNGNLVAIHIIDFWGPGDPDEV